MASICLGLNELDNLHCNGHFLCTSLIIGYCPKIAHDASTTNKLQTCIRNISKTMQTMVGMAISQLKID